jgi:DNA-binding beta-propeller fold protein YncE
MHPHSSAAGITYARTAQRRNVFGNWRKERVLPILGFIVVLLSASPAWADATWQSLGSLSAGTGPADQPQDAVDAGGNAVFVWRRSDGTTNCSGGPCLRIQARSRSAAGILSPIQTLSASGQHSSLPQLAVDANGDAVFVWQRFDGADLRIQTRSRSAAGTLGSTLTLSAAGQSAESPQVAVDANGDSVFVWQRFDGTNERIQARTLSAAGIRGSTRTLSAAGGDALFPQVEVDPNGNAVFAWERCCYDGTNNERIQARALSAAGTLGPTQTLSAAGRTGSSAHVAVDPSGNAVFAWIGSDGTVQRIQSRARSAAGILSSTQTLSDPGKNAFEPRVAVDLGGKATVLWQRFDGILNRVQVRARSAAGTLSPTQTVGDTGTAIPLGAQIAADPQGNAVAVWEHRDGTAVCCTRVEARVRSTDSTLGLTQFLSAADQVAREPQVALAPTGEAIAVWGETTTGNASVPDSKIHAAIGHY